jgi:hypothetical protein
MSPLSQVLLDNALNILKQERRSSRRVNAAYNVLRQSKGRPLVAGKVTGGVVDWLANPFVRTALSILQSLSSNYKIREAIKLIKEAGMEAEEEAKKKAKEKAKKKSRL